MIPETCVPALSTTPPFATKLWSRTPVKCRPGVACDEIAAFVRTTIDVPAGTVAPNDVAVVTKADNNARNNLLRFIRKNAFLFHRFQGGLAWRQAVLDVMFDRLDHYDGVTKHETDRQHETK